MPVLGDVIPIGTTTVDPAHAWTARARWHGAANGLVVGWLALAAFAAAFGGSLGLPSWLALHLFLLGAVTCAIVVWSDHFTRALLHAPDAGVRSLYGRLGVLTAGTGAVLLGTALGPPLLAGVGAVVVIAAIGWHVGALVRAIRRALPTRFGTLARWYVVAGIALLAGGPIGGLLATGLVPETAHARLHLAHAHLNLFGWVGLSVLGTLYVLGPTALGTAMTDGAARLARRLLVLLTAGLALAVAGVLAGSSPLAAAGVVAYGVGAGWSLSGLVHAALGKRPRSFASWSFVAAAGWLLVTLALDAVLLLAGDTGQVAETFSLLYAPLLAGFVGQVLSGSLSHLLPAVLGGGPAGATRLRSLLAFGWPVRLGAVNLGVLLVILPLPEPLGRAGWALLLLALGTFVALAGFVVLDRVAGGRAPAVAGALVGVLAILGATLLTVDRPAPAAVVDATRPVDITLRGMRVEPAVVSAPAGSRLVLRITNEDGQRHDLRLATGQRTRLLGNGETATIQTDPLRQTLQGWCTVAGHRAAGMTLTVKVGSAEAADTHQHSHGHQHGSGTQDSTQDQTQDSTHPEKAAPQQVHDPVLPPAPAGRTHRVEIRVKETERAVAPGVTQRVWTFGGTVPGPVLRGRVGDTFVVTLVNDGSLGHGIDFHAGALAPDRPMRTIDPGERLTYTFRATRAGAWLYHCSTAPISQHLANGMYGAVIIDPPNLTKVDREYLMVAGELYRGAPGSSSRVEKIRTGRPDGWMFNGAASQYADAPLSARADERVRFWVVNVGPGSTTAFHVVGTVFDTVYKEGAYLLRPDDPGGAQVLDLAPAQGGFAEVVFPEAGHYPFVDHDLRHAEAGAGGMVTVRP